MIKKKFSLEASRHVERAIRKGLRYHSGLFRANAFFKRGEQGFSRICVILPSKRFKTAVLRNKVRRQYKAAFSTLIQTNPNIDIVVFPNERSEIKFLILEQEAKKCFDFLRSKR